MTLVRLVTVAIRFYATMLAVDLALLIGNSLSSARLLYESPDIIYKVDLASRIGQAVALSTVVAFLFAKSEMAARFIVGADESLRLPGVRHTATVVFAVLGFTYLVDGLRSAIGIWAMWQFVPVDEFSGQRFVAPNVNPEQIASAAVLLIVGTLLFFGARSVVRLVLWLRTTPVRATGEMGPE